MVFDFNSKMFIEVIKNLQNRSVEILYWAASKKDFMEIFNDRTLFPGTIFHDANDAAAGIPADGIETSSFEPPSNEFIESLFECELRALIMMENIDRTHAPMMKKLHLYYLYVKYWYGVLSALKPDAIIFSDVPHMSFRYVIYCLARHLGIKQVMLRNMQIGGRMFVIDDFTEYKRLKKEIEINQGKNFTLNDLSPDVRDYYEKQRTTNKSPFYFRKEYSRNWQYQLHRFVPDRRSVIRNIKKFTLFKTTFLYIQMFFLKRDLPSLEKFRKPTWVIKLQEKKYNKIKLGFKEEYVRYQINPDYSKKYIYVPLQTQPERSTTAEGRAFIDQILMIDMLSHAIPRDWVIYVKENPLQWIKSRTHIGRFKGYTKELVAMKNVRVVSTETSTFDLIKEAQAIGTVGSTAALEAVLRGKPVLVFGHTWYVFCDGMFSVSSVETCKKAIEKIQKGYKPEQQKVINFLKAVDSTTIRAYKDIRFKKGEDLNKTYTANDEENAETLADAFYEELVSSK